VKFPLARSFTAHHGSFQTRQGLPAKMPKGQKACPFVYVQIGGSDKGTDLLVTKPAVTVA